MLNQAEKKKCYHCGNNPIPHGLNLANEYFMMFLHRLDGLNRSWLGRSVDRIMYAATGVLVKLGIVLKMAEIELDTAKITSTRLKVIIEEARSRGILCGRVTLFGRPTGICFAQIGRKEILFTVFPIPQKLKTDAVHWMDDKMVVKKKLIEAGLPVPHGGVFSSFASMRKAFDGLDKPVIVKPASGSRGRHTTTFINTEDELREAYRVGRKLAPRLVMEEHLVGSVYRGTIINGVLAGILRGDPPRITGDGKSTISELINTKNFHRHTKVKEYKISPLTAGFLKRSGDYSLEMVLPKGKTIDLTEKIGVSYGGYSAEEYDIAHPKIKEVLEKAGRAINYPVMGFDFIIGDITKDPDAQKWGIIECNSVPFLDLHHFPVEGTPRNAARHVWDMWEKQ
ncbi:MAG: hypothetical protein A3B23_00940 [Candidatus Colwellbacteria bacterium RIFCSPLOWO2_01_FULL_48_10]|uniref:ATP-grasp domain-containing protein n=2 Tax=Bacteria candidate phyla TaxID=1783234 RepID=A0A1F5P2Q7_9BACT|nr:MAG: hypothetical protein A2846_03980 [Candidatus Doudnabacteria bacterium RIFCSPHIGHO2_01_FULL_49_9]OGY59511.1 MAG: hypothetical protein A3B23_00940 [Candidatus Colwellbacteria bacterium RIFCSPLOWO2_01_FULL_48_10]